MAAHLRSGIVSSSFRFSASSKSHCNTTRQPMSDASSRTTPHQSTHHLVVDLGSGGYLHNLQLLAHFANNLCSIIIRSQAQHKTSATTMASSSSSAAAAAAAAVMGLCETSHARLTLLSQGDGLLDVHFLCASALHLLRQQCGAVYSITRVRYNSAVERRGCLRQSRHSQQPR